MNEKKTFLLVASALFLAGIACQTLFPKVIPPGSLEEQVAEGDIRFVGKGNVNNPGLGCQDPTAAVSVYIGPKTKELDGVTFYDYVNPVTVNAITDGVMVKGQECEKVGLDEKYDWAAKGIYYPKEEKIVFTTCASQNKYRAEGRAFLVGEGFEGEYSCWDKEVMYEVAFSAYQISK